MSVYIKGMKIPVTCCHCPLMGYDPEIEWNDGGRETQGAYICVMTHELIDNTKREDHCPLVPVPEHGRLIDADALTAKFKEMGLGEHSLIERFFADGVYVMIDYAPTIIPADKEGEG